MEPSSASELDAAQVKSESTITPEEGEIVADVIVGAVFSTLTKADDVADAPELSVTEAVQRIESETSISLASTVYVLPVAMVVPETVQI